MFSSKEGLSPHLALLALEAIQRAWLTHSDRPKYAEFASALEAGCAKIKEYFEKMADSEVYTLALRMYHTILLSLHYSFFALKFSTLLRS